MMSITAYTAGVFQSHELRPEEVLWCDSNPKQILEVEFREFTDDQTNWTKRENISCT